MAAENLFVEGLDPTPLPALGASELLQMQRLLTPESYVGFIYEGESEPDTVNNPHYLRFLWLDRTTGAIKYHNGTEWVTIINVASLSGGVLTAESVPISKLDPDADKSLNLIRVNTAGTAFEYITKANLFTSGELAVVKLAIGTSRQFLMTVGGSAAWTTLLPADILSTLGNNIIPITALLPTAAGYSIPRQNSTGAAVEWASPSTLFPNNSLPVANLDATDASKDYVLKINATGVPIWGVVPASSAAIPSPIPIMKVFYTTGSWSCPSGVGRIKFRAWGAGGGGTGAIGGGAGAYYEGSFVAIPGSDYTIVVGEGGASGVDGTDTYVIDPVVTTLFTAFGGKSALGTGGACDTLTDHSQNIAGGSGNATFGGMAPCGGQGGYNTTPGVAPGAGGGVNSAGAAGRVIIEY